MSEPSPNMPAATLVLMRQGVGDPELLFVERTARMAFAAGALVFPGGRVEADDHLVAGILGPNIEHGAARVAAIRETIEEVGVAAAFVQAPDAAQVRRMQQRLREETPFSTILAETGLELDLLALTPFARWCPAFRGPRLFDTLFFVAEAPDGDAAPVVDEREVSRAFWASASQILAEADAGRAHVIFPTRRNLERLALLDSIVAARAHCARYPVLPVEPWIEERDGAEWLCIPEGIGYPVTAEPMATVRRG